MRDAARLRAPPPDACASPSGIRRAQRRRGKSTHRPRAGRAAGESRRRSVVRDEPPAVRRIHHQPSVVVGRAVVPPHRPALSEGTLCFVHGHARDTRCFDIAGRPRTSLGTSGLHQFTHPATSLGLRTGTDWSRATSAPRTTMYRPSGVRMLSTRPGHIVGFASLVRNLRHNSIIAMAQPKDRSSKKTSADTSAAVDAFMATLEHPHKDAIAALRDVVRGADPSIAEGVKWNVPSFRTHEYFATTHLRAKVGLGLILHLGERFATTRADRASRIPTACWCGLPRIERWCTLPTSPTSMPARRPYRQSFGSGSRLCEHGGSEGERWDCSGTSSSRMQSTSSKTRPRRSTSASAGSSSELKQTRELLQVVITRLEENLRTDLDRDGKVGGA